jgi:hypothetical protein
MIKQNSTGIALTGCKIVKLNKLKYIKGVYNVKYVEKLIW